eukprot:998155-Rhodomonas_salina.6
MALPTQRRVQVTARGSMDGVCSYTICLRYEPMPPLVLTRGVLLPGVQSLARWPRYRVLLACTPAVHCPRLCCCYRYAHAMRCPVLTSAMLLPGSIAATSPTALKRIVRKLGRLRYRPTRARYAMPGTEIVYQTTAEVGSYGTAMRCPVLPQRGRYSATHSLCGIQYWHRLSATQVRPVYAMPDCPLRTRRKSYAPTRRPVPAYAPAMRCPVLLYRMPCDVRYCASVWWGIVPRACARWYLARATRWPVLSESMLLPDCELWLPIAEKGLAKAYEGPTSLRARYAMSGTDAASGLSPYARAMQSPVLT